MSFPKGWAEGASLKALFLLEAPPGEGVGATAASIGRGETPEAGDGADTFSFSISFCIGHIRNIPNASPASTLSHSPQ